MSKVLDILKAIGLGLLDLLILVFSPVIAVVAAVAMIFMAAYCVVTKKPEES